LLSEGFSANSAAVLCDLSDLRLWVCPKVIKKLETLRSHRIRAEFAEVAKLPDPQDTELNQALACFSAMSPIMGSLNFWPW
jgi:hypothetical protein